MGDTEDYFPEKGRRKPYPSLKQLARKRDDWEGRREKKGKR